MRTIKRLLAKAFGWIIGKQPRVRGVEHEGSRPVAWSSMAALLEDLEAIGAEHDELFDTDVRERMWAIVDAALIKQTTEIAVPAELGMFTAEGNAKLRAALEFNLTRLRQVFAIFQLDTEQKRRASFFNPRLHTEQGRHVDDFFGHP